MKHFPSKDKLEAWIREVGREIGLRTHVYPKLVKKGQMQPEEASAHKRNMEEIYEFLKSLRTEEPIYATRHEHQPEPKDALANW